MHDKISLLMEETGCDQGEAELALEMCGFQVEDAVKAIPRLLKNILTLKGRFFDPEQHRFGLLLVVINLKSRALLRARAVVSFNPAVYAVSLEKDWFEFEKHLYGCRLWEGSLQADSQEIERRLGESLGAVSSAAYAPGAENGAALDAELSGALREWLGGGVVNLQLKKEILDLGSFQALRGGNDREPRRRARARKPEPRPEEPLVLKVALEEQAEGPEAGGLRAGDVVCALIDDPRDIAQYLAKLLGGFSQGLPRAIAAPVEAVEATPAGLMVRVRFAVGVCGDAAAAPAARVKLVRRLRDAGEPGVSWWRRFFGS